MTKSGGLKIFWNSWKVDALVFYFFIYSNRFGRWKIMDPPISIFLSYVIQLIPGTSQSIRVPNWTEIWNCARTLRCLYVLISRVFHFYFVLEANHEYWLWLPMSGSRLFIVEVSRIKSAIRSRERSSLTRFSSCKVFILENMIYFLTTWSTAISSHIRRREKNGKFLFFFFNALCRPPELSYVALVISLQLFVFFFSFFQPLRWSHKQKIFRYVTKASNSYHVVRGARKVLHIWRNKNRKHVPDRF